MHALHFTINGKVCFMAFIKLAQLLKIIELNQSLQFKIETLEEKKIYIISK